MPSPPRVPPTRAQRATVADVRHAKARRRRRRRIARFTALAALAIVLMAALGGLAWADHSSADTIPTGVTVGGIDVGGLSKRAGLSKLDRRIGTPSRRPVSVTVQGRTSTLTAEEAGVQMDLPGAVDEALATGRKGNFVARGWRAVTGTAVHAQIPASVAVDRRAVGGFVGGLAKQVAKPALNAELSLSVTDVAVTPGRDGRRLAGGSKLQHRIVRAFRSPAADRHFRAKIAAVKPAVTEEQVWASNPTVVTVSRADRTVRVFKRGSVATTYKVAVGMRKYPTPTGRFAVERKEQNPVWNVPDAAWAGDLAGKTIPGGDPRNPLVARWVGISGSVGFHGTTALGSLGSPASHGCVRMRPADVIDLYERVEVGTPILIV